MASWRNTRNKKHVYKERKEITHVRVGERNINQHIKKKKYNVCKDGHKTDVQEEGGKHSPYQDETHLPLTEACISPPNMQNLRKKKKIIKSPQFLPLFVMIDKGCKKLESFT